MRMQYWEDVCKVRKMILQDLKEAGISFIEVNAMQFACPMFNCIEPNGAIGLTCECNGLPTSLWTPLGEINFIKRKVGFYIEQGKEMNRCSDEQVTSFMEKLKADFGLKLVKINNIYGNLEPVYTVTKLPWTPEAKELPELVERKMPREELDEAYEKAKELAHRLANSGKL